MIKRIKDNWESILLAIVVLLSLILSGIVWANPYHGEHRFGDSNVGSTKETTTQTMRDIYLPTQVVKTNSDQAQYLLYGQKENPILTVRQVMEKWKFYRLSRVETGRESAYHNYLRTDNSLMLTYPDTVPTTILNDSFNQDLSSRNLKKINHIVIPLDSKNQIFLLGDNGYKIYRVSVKKNNLKRIKNSLRGGSRISVDHKIINGRPIMTYPRSIKVPEYSYQVDKLNVDTLSQTLMNSSKNSSVTRRTEGDNTVYQDGASKRMTYNSSRGTIDYESYAGKSTQYGYQQVYGHLYNLLAKTTTPLNSLRFDDYDSRTGAITYRSYVENFPIFNDNGYGTAQIQENNDGVQRYQISQYSVTVPLPTSRRKVELPSSAVLFNGLRASGKVKDMRGLRIGYQWDNSKTGPSLTLKPTYFIKYKGSWVDYTALTK